MMEIGKFQEISYVVVFIMIISFIFYTAIEPSKHTFDSYIDIEVTEGDTLWAIASKHADDIDVSSFISFVKNRNNLSTDVIYPGQVLSIPKNSKVNVDESDYLLSSKY